MPTTRAVKRRRCGDDLLTLFQSDVGPKILSYASGKDLCTLDLLNKQFQALTAEPWKKLTKERFGMNDGKDGWRLGTSFLRPPVFISLIEEIDWDRDRDYRFHDGSSRMAANESIIVVISGLNGLPGGDDNEMRLRDTSTLEHIQTQPSPIHNYQVAICGPAGSKIIVTSNNRQVYAQRGNITQIWSYRINNQDGNGIQLLGSERHLIILFNGKIKIYEVNSVGESTLLSLQRSVSVEEGAGNENRDDFTEDMIAWGPDKSDFIVCYPHLICVWDFDAATNNISLTRTITVNDWNVGNVALSNDYIVASSEDKKIHIWERSTGDKLHSALCEVDEDDQLDIEDCIYPIQMSCHGNILVSTSHYGCRLCVWDMKTGQLLIRRNDAEEEHVATPDFDAKDMVYLKHLNGFLCLTQSMHTWSFPTDQRQSDKAASIRQKEEALLRRLQGYD